MSALNKEICFRCGAPEQWALIGKDWYCGVCIEELKHKYEHYDDVESEDELPE